LAAFVYILCAGAALGCAVLLLRAYRRSRLRLLLWSGICFSFLTASNALIAIDLIAFPDVSLFLVRNLTALVGMAFLLWGLIWDSR
jgi:hypothetical protein